ncbi:D-lactaldehyde dehydrogenase [Pholiota conissans]|uniref:D-lactaldehyde dehydrogenase n=1 Tax=Pholiota conissans TaxID=109636 RepID=A0A9P5Z7B1_9AGAR|nr:D-lactaldehyde dehydrogenase [Pholiota conissans]
MTAIAKGSKVLVTGANGYIPMWVVRILLERGYTVRATVRTAGNIGYIKEYFAKLGYGDNKLEFVVVEDIIKEDAFDEAVKGMDGIIHMASPFHHHAKNPQEVISPAVQGTIGVLKSAYKNGTNVKRIVVTSSTASIHGTLEPHKFTELDWNTHSPSIIEEQGEKSNPIYIYLASKTLAERAAWEFVGKVKAEVNWDLAVINPTYVFGPPIHDLKSVTSLNTSLAMWYGSIFPEVPKTKEELTQSLTWVDVRDVALTHVFALEIPEAGGERFIASAESFIWQDWLDALNTLQTNPLPSHAIAKGFPELSAGEKTYDVVYETTKAHDVLGVKWTSMADSGRDTLAEFAKRGW